MMRNKLRNQLQLLVKDLRKTQRDHHPPLKTGHKTSVEDFSTVGRVHHNFEKNYQRIHLHKVSST